MPKNNCVKMAKDGRERLVCWSIDRKQLKDQGWVILGEEKPEPKTVEPAKLPEIAVEAGVDAYAMEAKVDEPSESLDEMTKAELLDWALERGHDLPNNDRKSEILEACKQIEAEG